MPESEYRNPDILKGKELKDKISKLLSTISKGVPLVRHDIILKITQELNSRGYINNTPPPGVDINPRHCLENYAAWHHMIGSSFGLFVPDYEDLPGEDNIVHLLSNLVRELK